ncbi:uncharacterized protein LOC142548338 [Primulina tabacum]|uniref:uncharacterized protein LOC142548338 n=1 Tax=Primulina tabacum TaxID=48773 RepID=UPI003F5A3FE2
MQNFLNHVGGFSPTEALDQLDLKDYNLEHVETTIFGFSGHTVHPRGEIMVPLTMGSGELRNTQNISIFPNPKKSQKFGWDNKAEQAFQELKSHLVGLPISVKLGLGEKLLIYLSATDRAISSVLIQERADQSLVYYVSHALRGPEMSYTELEKIVLALSRTAIKAQALSDFLTEMTQLGQEKVWRVFVDGAASKEGSGVGVVLISSTWENVKVTVRLDSWASNNEAEYESVVIGMKTVRETGATRIIVY